MEYHIIKIPIWCEIGKTVLWNAPSITDQDWAKEKIISYGHDGFFHQAHNCPVYFTKFSEFGITVKLGEE